MMAAIRIRNGSDRPTFTTVLSTVNTRGFGNSPRVEVLCRMIPAGVPMSTTSTMVTPTITHVSP